MRPASARTRSHPARRDHEVHALGGEALSDREADADAAASDDGDLALEPEIHDAPPIAARLYQQV